MKKLYKKENKMHETIEAYAACASGCGCSCSSGCKTKVGKVIKQFGNYTASTTSVYVGMQAISDVSNR